MSSTDKSVQQHLRDAIEAATPDVLPEILLRIEQEKKNAALPEASAEDNSHVVSLSGAKRRRTTLPSAFRWMGAMAAALILVFGLYTGYGYYRPESIISFDVNPSIELKVNRSERVLAATPLNKDGEIVLSDMNLKSVDLGVAVNALIGSMVKNGYISEVKNSILITVDGRDGTSAATLQKKLSDEVGSLLDAYSVNGAVLSQTLTEDERIRALAEQHGISFGKAALVDLIVGQDETLTFTGVAQLSINDINLLIASRQADLQGVAATGEASSRAYIGEETARAAALAHAGLSQADVRFTKTKIDYDDGHMLYDVEFHSGNIEYEYEIDALTGAVLDCEFEADNDHNDRPLEENEQPTGGQGGYIGTEQATDIALGHAGENRSGVTVVKAVYYEKQGRVRYDIIFLTASAKYSYEIDALTGEVIAHYRNALRGESGRQDGDSDDRQENSEQYIGSDRAKAIALNHAGVQADVLYDFDIQLDSEDDRMIYEIEFKCGGYEYEYEIDALSGEVLWWESEEN